MEILRVETLELSFGPFDTFHEIPLSRPLIPGAAGPDERDRITDIDICLYSRPASQPKDSTGFCPESVRVYYCHSNLAPLDLTDNIVSAIQGDLAGRAPDVLKRQYEKAIDGWIHTASRFASVLNGLDLKKEEQLKRDLLAKDPAKWLNALGDRNIGWGGNSHVFNFLYRNVDVTPLSLRALLANKEPKSPLPDHEAASLVVSTGGWSAIPNQPNPTDAVGSFHIRLGYHHHNPNDDKILEIVDSLKRFDTKVTFLIRQLTDLKSIATRLATTVASSEQAVNSHTLQLQAIKTRMHDLQAAVEHIK